VGGGEERREEEELESQWASLGPRTGQGGEGGGGRRDSHPPVSGASGTD